MGLFSTIKRMVFRSNQDSFQERTAAFGIDTSGPEFWDLYPTLPDIRDCLLDTGVIREKDIDWIAQMMHQKIVDGAGFCKIVKQLVRSGEPLST